MGINYVYPLYEVIRNKDKCIAAVYASASVQTKCITMTPSVT